jgi:hypothetical protein
LVLPFFSCDYSGRQDSGVRIQNGTRIDFQHLADHNKQSAPLIDVAVLKVLGENQVVARLLDRPLGDVAIAQFVCFSTFLTPSAMFAAMEAAAKSG